MSFEPNKHIKYLLHCLDILPQPYTSLDTSRLSVAYFCVSGLDVLGALARVDSKRVVDWIYSLQVLPPPEGADGLSAERCGGFRGCGYLGAAYAPGGAVVRAPIRLASA
jgi:geranylgeranyl transferase type-1 subunit beta